MGKSSHDSGIFGGNINDESIPSQDDEFFDAIESTTPVKRKLETIKTAAKEKSKHVLQSLRPTNPRNDSVAPRQPPQGLTEDPAFDPSRLGAPQRVTPGGAIDKVLGTLKATGKAVVNPKITAKKKAASKIAVTDRPYLSQQADDEYISAHADFNDYNPGTSAGSSEDDEEPARVKETRHRVRQLEDIRDSRKVAWTTSSHIHRVAAIVDARVNAPDRKLFTVTDEKSGASVIKYDEYLYALNRYYLKSLAVSNMGEIDLAPQRGFDTDVCTKYMERLLIATSPWQSWFLSMRQLYRWENPRKTAKWAVIWFVIWYMDYVMTFVFCWTGFIVLENRFRKKRVEQLRESHRRAKSNNMTAFRFNELIHRHGSTDWLDPLIEEAGPMVQMQLSDLADFLEILNNFYDWRYPAKTWATLFWFVCAIIMGVALPTGYNMKILWMFCLLSFFLGRPIASRHPQYRHVVNALKWIFWDIPTDAEWSMMYLRQKAQETRAKLLDKQVDEKYKDCRDRLLEESLPCIDDGNAIPTLVLSRRASSSSVSASDTDSIETLPMDQPIYNFKTRYKSLRCRLLLYPWGIAVRPPSALRARAFPRALSEIYWQQFREIRKVTFSNRHAANLLKNVGLELIIEGDLSFRSDNDPKHRGEDSESDSASTDTASSQRRIRFKALKNRDQVFNLLIGFSGLKYQVLPPLSSKRSDKDQCEVVHHPGQAVIDVSGDAESDLRYRKGGSSPVTVPDDPFR